MPAELERIVIWASLVAAIAFGGSIALSMAPELGIAPGLSLAVFGGLAGGGTVLLIWTITAAIHDFTTRGRL